MKTKKESGTSNENAASFYSKLSEKEKALFRESANLIIPEKKVLTFDDLIKFEKAKESLASLKEKYKINLDELFDFVKEQLFFPVSVFNKEQTVLESVVKYLKEEKNLSLSKISGILGRDQRNIWHIYNKANKKSSKKFSSGEIKFWIPASIFSNTKLSALESVVSYIKDEFSLSYHEIALLLKRNDRTIWTVYQRANKKNVESK
jgi:protein involved in ribonucleotide reduction